MTYTALATPTKIRPGLLTLLPLALHRLQALAHLSRLTEAQLADAALIPSDLAEVARLPLSADIATRLALRAGARAGNW